MRCYQCPKPALFMVGDPGQAIPLCLDCNSKFQEVIDRQMENSERMLNHLAAEMEATVGMSGLVPRFPPRRPRTVIQSGKVTMHNINIDRSNIGVVNTGYIGSVDSAVGSMRAAGEANAADAFRGFTEKLLRLPDVDPKEKDAILELLSLLATEATMPPEKRRSSAMRTLLAELANLVSGIASAAQLHAQYAPLIARLFA